MVVTTQVLGFRYDYRLYLNGVIATNYQCLKLINNTQTQTSHLSPPFYPKEVLFHIESWAIIVSMTRTRNSKLKF